MLLADRRLIVPRVTAERNDGALPARRVSHTRVVRGICEFGIHGYHQRRAATAIPEPADTGVPDLPGRALTAETANRAPAVGSRCDISPG